MNAPSAARVRTRIAPSPTGFLHLGTARTALYSWAFARHHGGDFVLRIEDTDVGRSTQASSAQIVDAMQWLGLAWDEGPVFQMQRLERYHAVAERLIAAGAAYRCWSTPAELDAAREAQRARGEKTHYDGRWRPAPGKVLPTPPPGVQPVVRLAHPADGAVQWDDLVKGPITIRNEEFDDLVLLRPAPAGSPPDAFGVPTYNFAVVVDDVDMAITHVFRGDEHINNTPWQIHLFEALGAPLPRFGHCPIILGDDGQKLSKRRGAVSVTAYRDAGYLPEALLNYLARLGWSHGDEEVFTRAQFVAWFDGSHLSKSPAQWDPAKLAWVNAQHLKAADDTRLARLLHGVLTAREGDGGGAPDGAPDSATASAPASPADSAVADDARLARAAALFKDRCSTVVELADWARMLVAPPTPSAEDLQRHVTDAVAPALRDLRERLAAAPSWDAGAIAAALKATLAASGLKMPALAPAVRVLVCGRPQTPSLDAVLALFDRATVLSRLPGP